MSSPAGSPPRSTPTASVRCPRCGALNPSSADWCGQCLEPRARKATDVPPAPPPPSSGSRPSSLQPQGEHDPRGATATLDGGAGTWRCSVCESENPLQADQCGVCGASFARSMRPDQPTRVQRDPGKTALYSLFCPGAGHAYLGEWGQAVARFVLSAWVVTVALLSGLQGRSGVAWTTAILFGLIAFCLWLIAAHDAYREATGARSAVILKGRMIVYLVIALLVLMMILLVFGTLAANAG